MSTFIMYSQREHIQENSCPYTCSFNLRTTGLIWYEHYIFSDNLKLMFKFKQHVISTPHETKHVR